MAKTKISEYDSTAANNTDIDSINIAEGMAPSNVNNAIRELMAHLKDMDTGTSALSSLSISSNPAIIKMEDTGGGSNDKKAQIQVDSGVFEINTRNDDDSSLVNDAFTIQLDDGHIGIGTNNPAYGRLHIADGNSDIAMDANGSGQLHIDGNGYGFGVALNADGAQIYTNTTSRDLIFGTDETERMRITDGNVGIGTSSPDGDLHVYDADGDCNLILETGTNNCQIGFGDSASNFVGKIQYNHPSNFMAFTTNASEAMRIDSSGDLLHGTTDTTLYNNSSGETGTHIRSDGRIYNTTDDNTNIILNRMGTTEGPSIQFRRNGSTVGEIGYTSAFYIADTGVGLRFDVAGTDNILPCDQDGDLRDNAVDLGVNTTGRFDDIFATNGTIQTSDEREKQQIASLTDAEITAAKAISKLFKTFKWNDKVEAKGDAARTHTGVIAQQVETAMSDAGLDAGNYAFFISTTWWETQTEVAAVEADEENGIEAQEAYTRTDTYNTQEEAPEGATERNRKGIRYPELLSFIGAATEQRLTSIEARLDALEG